MVSVTRAKNKSNFQIKKEILEDALKVIGTTFYSPTYGIIQLN
jgi:hypothetical protein